MNERIRQLMNQARALYRNQDLPYEQGLVEYSEKFAELIVQECIKVCKSRVSNSDYNTGRMHCASDIKEHFGVE